jgi:tRNA threonylcarbamoyladenosine biosynthesis protein TsaE
MVLRSAAALRRWGTTFASGLRPSSVVCLQGPLGAGKTTLSQAICAALGVTEPVTSPTYTLINTYQGQLPVVHMDLYRLSGPDEFEAIGGWEVLESGAVCLIEWPERLGGELTRPHWWLSLSLLPVGRSLVVSVPVEVAPA